MGNFIDQSKNFPFELLQWYRQHQRKLPWRETTDPYKIWLSEIILQQTRVDQGMKYYQKFVRKYPEVGDLAMAAEEEVLKDWQGLGYYSRARNLHHAANTIVAEMQGKFPNTYKDIKQLKGVGDYTAAAIASFAFGEPQAVVDGNVYRLLSRYFGIATPIDSSRGKKIFAELAQTIIPKNEAAEYNQAIMEFGALQCKPVNPNCERCPLQAKCMAFNEAKIEQLPVKDKKTKVRNRYLHYLIIESDGHLLLNHRSEKGIWHKLFDFPLVEIDQLISWDKLQELNELQALLGNSDFSFEGESKERKHLLSHQRLHCRFFHFKADQLDDELRSRYRQVPLRELGTYPIPKLIENYLGEETNLLSLFN